MAITLHLADRFTNKIEFPTPVVFRTEAGQITALNAPNADDSVAVAKLRTDLPVPLDVTPGGPSNGEYLELPDEP